MWDSLRAIDPRPAISSVRPTLVVLAEPAASQQAQAGHAGVRDSVVRERPFVTATDEATVGQSAEVLGGVLVALGRGLCELLYGRFATPEQRVEDVKPQ